MNSCFLGLSGVDHDDVTGDGSALGGSIGVGEAGHLCHDELALVGLEVLFEGRAAFGLRRREGLGVVHAAALIGSQKVPNEFMVPGKSF